MFTSLSAASLRGSHPYCRGNRSSHWFFLAQVGAAIEASAQKLFALVKQSFSLFSLPLLRLLPHDSKHSIWCITREALITMVRLILHAIISVEFCWTSCGTAKRMYHRCLLMDGRCSGSAAVQGLVNLSVTVSHA
ncbi:hypothetical protein CY34DRAFT_365708 [Suillus luteus UH-Slu-Lm8-n1]|uniref:Uncharacterized protein n=1 Tax=Suillus luteus UH-Slu-Lm8-n1 TaxID=930992 RepID=A0A0D0B4T5_9AGAM|nr:hypothetical protein CY34DRAFT_365708 [Suillus luteus UH-Slu-Lm8-n1]